MKLESDRWQRRSRKTRLTSDAEKKNSTDVDEAMASNGDADCSSAVRITV